VDGQWEVYVISANGDRPQRLTTDPASDVLPSWSRDGKWIYFASNRNGEYQVWKMPAKGGEAVPVTHKGGFVGFESRDGKWVYYSKGDDMASSLWKVPVEGGEETQVLARVAHRAFAVVGEGIYFISPSDHLIQLFSLTTRKVKPVAIIGKPFLTGFTVSPDGQWALYSQLDQLGSDLMLVENFH
jgi:Tol biopolymer transport system component